MPDYGGVRECVRIRLRSARHLWANLRAVKEDNPSLGGRQGAQRTSRLARAQGAGWQCRAGSDAGKDALGAPSHPVFELCGGHSRNRERVSSRDLHSRRRRTLIPARNRPTVGRPPKRARTLASIILKR
eukprot:1977004-Pyramimonas_sp.AAC.1